MYYKTPHKWGVFIIFFLLSSFESWRRIADNVLIVIDNERIRIILVGITAISIADSIQILHKGKVRICRRNFRVYETTRRIRTSSYRIPRVEYPQEYELEIRIFGSLNSTLSSKHSLDE